MRIGVFDSGIGGEAVANELSEAFPAAEIFVEDDRANMPYGSREPDDIQKLVDAAIQPLLQKNCDVIVVACNTATAVAIEWLRTTYPNMNFIGLEPMIKPAQSLTKTGVIAVCATPATLTSQRYKQAKNVYTPNMRIFEPDCSNWASLIERNDLNQNEIDAVAAECINVNADVVVLACTHYHWIQEQLEYALGPSVTILEPSKAIINCVKEIVEL